MNNRSLNGTKVSFCPLLLMGLGLAAGCSPAPEGSSQAISADASRAAGETVRSAGSRFSSEELQKILQQHDATTLSESLNKVKKLGASRDGLQLLEHVWSGDRSQYPEFAWSTIEDPQVRLNLADILVQAAWNGEIKNEPAGAHEFVLDVIDTQPPRLVSQALITLSTFERDDDVAVIEQVALQHDQRTFRSAVAALSSMCAPAAEAALDRIEQSSAISEKEFINDTRVRLSDYRQRAGGCAPR